MPLELLLIAVGALWLCIGVVAVALCVVAARGDRQILELASPRVRSGRFARRGAASKALR